MRTLFSGPHGTGKTLASEVVARLDVDLYSVALDAVVSKYIGKTEKNLKRAFLRPKRSTWSFFFDEANALLGKRTEVGEVCNRYSNLKADYLHQGIEECKGIVLLATNIRENIDSALTLL